MNTSSDGTRSDAPPPLVPKWRRMPALVLLVAGYGFFFVLPTAPTPLIATKPEVDTLLLVFACGVGLLTFCLLLLTRAGRQSVADRYPGRLGVQLLVAALVGPLFVLAWSWFAGYRAVSAINTLTARTEIQRGVVVVARETESGRKCAPVVQVRWGASVEPERHCMSHRAFAELPVGTLVTRRVYHGRFGKGTSNRVEPLNGYSTGAQAAETKRDFTVMFWFTVGPITGLLAVWALLKDRWGWAAAAFVPMVAFGLL